jgi:hypothetical protein
MSGNPNPVFRKYIAAAKNHIALIPRNIYDLASVIFTLLIVLGACGGAKAVFNGAPSSSFFPFSFAFIGIVGLFVMRI